MLFISLATLYTNLAINVCKYMYTLIYCRHIYLDYSKKVRSKYIYGEVNTRSV